MNIKKLLIHSLKINYLNQFRLDIQQASNFLPYKNQNNNRFIQFNKSDIKKQLESTTSQLRAIYLKLDFNIKFFRKIGFFNSNIVAIGANGSGKTSLSNKLKTYIENNGVVVSAQRILLIPDFNAIENPTTTSQTLKIYQINDKTNKNPDGFHFLQNEFAVILKALLADNILIGNKYKIDATAMAKSGDLISIPPVSNLDKTLNIWNSLIEHRKLECNDGMNITVSSDDKSYKIVQMSDGEKVMLFLIAQILQAPKDGFIIVDEPEMYLHKTILKKLWDILEKERQDCIFIYLTHDLNFATSRITAKKIWIKSFIYPDNWDIETVPENELPESLILELLGSRKNILFCEGERGGIDEKIYSILFPKFTITPVGGCIHVINYTKAFNKIDILSTKAYGLIDSDHQIPERLNLLKKSNVFSFSVAEVENLLLNEDFLIVLAATLLVDTNTIENIKADVLNELKKHKETQAANFVSNQIDYYFKDSNVKKANSLTELFSHFKSFNEEIDLDDIYNKRISELDEILTNNDYNKTIAIYNNKGLKTIINKHFKISDFTDRAIKLLQFDENTHPILLKYFPEELKE